jgi:hypothetical protein
VLSARAICPAQLARDSLPKPMPYRANFPESAIVYQPLQSLWFTFVNSQMEMVLPVPELSVCDARVNATLRFV